MVDGVPIPFASPRMLYRMKEKTHREKDRGDLQFLRENYAEEIFGKQDQRWSFKRGRVRLAGLAGPFAGESGDTRS
jgi:hypothetical protein